MLTLERRHKVSSERSVSIYLGSNFDLDRWKKVDLKRQHKVELHQLRSGWTMVHKIIVCHMLLTFFTVQVVSVMKFVIPFSFFETSQVRNRLVRAALRNHNPLLKKLGRLTAVEKSTLHEE